MTDSNEQNDVLVLLDLMERLWEFKKKNIISTQEFEIKKAEIMGQISVMFASPIYAYEVVGDIGADAETSEEVIETDYTYEKNEHQPLVNQSRNSKRTLGTMLCVIAVVVVLFAGIRYPMRVTALTELADNYRELGLVSHRLAQESSGMTQYVYNSEAIDDFNAATEALELRKGMIIQGCLVGGAGIALGVAGVICLKKKDS